MKKTITMFLACAVSLSATADEEPAYTWGNLLTLESISNVQGGLREGSRNLANLDLTLSIDTHAAGWWENGTLFTYVLGNYGKPPSELTGELQTLSNIEANNNLILYEFWYQHSFVEGAVKLLVGLHDFNSTFYALESSSLFNLSSMGIGPEVAQVTPSIFPVTATTLHLTFSHKDQYLLVAAYDGIAGDPAHQHGTHIKFGKDDGLFIATEWGFAHESDYKFALGAWRHTAKVENPIDGGLSDSNSGLYLLGEKYWSEHLATFFQYGTANKNKNQLSEYCGAGFTYKNWLVDNDNVGVAYARAKNSKAYLKQNTDLFSAETVVELSYLRPLLKKLDVQASIYSIEHPSMEPDIDNSLALGLRLYIKI